jgi:hypothetical protein
MEHHEQYDDGPAKVCDTLNAGIDPPRGLVYKLSV